MAKNKAIDNSGFDQTTAKTSFKYYDAEGKSTIVKTGVGFRDKWNLYLDLLNMSNLQYLLLIFFIFFFINLIFASIYFMIGPDSIGLTTTDRYCWRTFSDCFFFSAQTLTTVGYGKIAPSSFAGNLVAAIESFTGLLLVALITGTSYGRFARPRSYIRFSQRAIMAPYEGGTAIMFRLANPSKYPLSDVEVSFILAMNVDKDGGEVQQFFQLPLEISKINTLVLSWTLVHAIRADSPLYGLNQSEMIARNAEILIFLKGFDEHFSAQVQQRYSYIAKDILWGYKFKKMHGPDHNLGRIVLRVDELNEMTKVSLPSV